jgi:hypothetical protein
MIKGATLSIQIRSASMAATAVMLAFTMSACDLVNNAQGPVALSLRDSLLVAVVCAQQDSVGVLAQARNETTGDRWKTFWKASGAHPFSRGDTIETTGLVEFYDDVEAADEPDLNPGSSVSIALLASAGPNIGGSFTLTEDFFSQEGWLHPDGTYSSDACPEP